MSGKLSPTQRRAMRRERNKTSLDMNLVSLIDVFTILIFFLLFNVGAAELLTPTRAVKLPESTAEASPRETVVVTVTKDEIVVGSRKVASVAEVLANADDLIPALQTELLDQAARKVVRADNAAAAKAVTIMGDKDIPYQLLRKVMVTCAKADYADVAFALNRKVSS
jgi:biopolymer transport protein TolR